MSVCNLATEFWVCAWNLCTCACLHCAAYFLCVCECKLFWLGWQLKKCSVSMNSEKLPLQNLQQRLLKSLFKSVGEEMQPQSSSNASSLSRSSEINLTHHLAGKSSRLRLWRGNKPLTKCFPLKYCSDDICPLLTLWAQITQRTFLPQYEMRMYPRCKPPRKAVDIDS